MWTWLTTARGRQTNKRTKQAYPASGFRLERLEERDVPAITIQISYAYDTSGFFKNNPTAEATLQLAANQLASQLNTSLAAISPSGANTWTESFYDPANGQIVTVNNPSIAANTIVVYAGARALGSAQASQGAFGGYGISGSQAWVNALQGRSPGWGTLLWGGSIAFDSTTNWYYGSAASGLQSNQEDFLTCATHELAHVLGLGTSSKWFAQVSKNTFTGSHAESVYGGPVPVTWGNSELNNVSVKGIPALMNLDLPLGTRTAPFTTLDWSLLEDIGWSVTIPSPPSPPVSPPPTTTSPPTAPPTVTSPIPVSPPAATTLPLLVSGASNGLVSVYTAGTGGTLTAAGMSYAPFPGYKGTVRSSVGYFTNSTTLEYAFVTGSGTAAELTIINAATGATIVAPTSILGGFTGGAFVTEGNLTVNGVDDLVVSEDSGGQPLVQVYQVSGSQLKLVTSFDAFSTSITSGVRIAMGDFTNNGIDDLVVAAGPGTAPLVGIISGSSLAANAPALLAPAFYAFPTTVTAGVNVSVGDLTGDGYADLILSQDSGGSSLVEIWSGANIAANLTKPLSSLTTYLSFYSNGSQNTGTRTEVEVVNGVSELVTAPASGTLDWMRVLTVTPTSVNAFTAVLPFGTTTTLSGIYLDG